LLRGFRLWAIILSQKEKTMKKIVALCTVFVAFCTAAGAASMTLYYTPTCPFCHHAKDYINDHLRDEFPDLNVIEINVAERVNQRVFRDAVGRCGLDGGGVPLIVIGDECIQGFGTETGARMREAIQNLPAPEPVPVTEELAEAIETAEQEMEEAAEEIRAVREREGGSISIFMMALAAITLLSLGAVLFARKKK
jgi:glutaredoxin